MTPPGFRSQGGITEPCPSNSFRELWLPTFQAGDCSSCGEGVKLDMTERIQVHHLNGTTSWLAVGTTSEDCCEFWQQCCYQQGARGSCRAGWDSRRGVVVYRY